MDRRIHSPSSLSLFITSVTFLMNNLKNGPLSALGPSSKEVDLCCVVPSQNYLHRRSETVCMDIDTNVYMVVCWLQISLFCFCCCCLCINFCLCGLLTHIVSMIIVRRKGWRSRRTGNPDAFNVWEIFSTSECTLCKTSCGVSHYVVLLH